jgi:hypothetical protein
MGIWKGDLAGPASAGETAVGRGKIEVKGPVFAGAPGVDLSPLLP